MIPDFPANPIHNAGYILEWHDEFDVPELDTGKWLPYYLPHWSTRKRSEPRYGFREGALVLQITEDQQPWCPEFDEREKQDKFFFCSTPVLTTAIKVL